MLSMFDNISNVVSDQLGNIINEDNLSQAKKDDYINQREYLNDFATDEFITKNIRVRPSTELLDKEILDRD